jgi:hypothetical protein
MYTQVCAHFRCFKYVYKYTFKAPDHTAVCVDEIEAHLAGRETMMPVLLRTSIHHQVMRMAAERQLINPMDHVTNHWK